jgi:hypothetical protein
MKEKVILEIPIYPYSQSEFNKRWEAYIRKIANPHPEISNDIVERMSLHFSLRKIWKYNQIIGIIVVAVNDKNIEFHLFMCDKSKYYFSSSTKNYMQMYPSVQKTYYIDEQTEDELKNAIRTKIERIKKENLKTSYYVDCSVFDNVIDYINIKGIMRKLK